MPSGSTRGIYHHNLERDDDRREVITLQAWRDRRRHGTTDTIIRPPFSKAGPTRRGLLTALGGAAAAFALPWTALAQSSGTPFPQWVANFRARALARGISGATYDRVMGAVKPDTTVFAQIRSQPEFNEQIWQYLNRRVSDWRIADRPGARQGACARCSPASRRISASSGPSSSACGAWNRPIGDPVVQRNHMRPVIPSLAALAWGEPRRRAYWEQELINALRIVERGWSTPEEMRGSWAGAMGHTQWMPEVWLNVGFDYDGDGRVNPFGKPDDALASSARYLVQRGKYRRGEHWGYEVKAPGGASGGSRTYEAWRAAGFVRADGQPFPQPDGDRAPVDSGAGRPGLPARPELLRGALLQSVDELHALDRASRRPRDGRRTVREAIPRRRARPRPSRRPRRCRSASPRPASTPRAPTAGSAPAPCRRCRHFQRKMGLEPADGYAGLKVLGKLRSM